MKKILSLLQLLLLACAAQSQQLAQVSFSNGSSLSYFSLLTDRSVFIRISAEGKILEWGTEEQSLRSSTYYAPRLQPYMGRVEYYGPEADSLSRGKVKSIGSSIITYYNYYESEERKGKIRSVGSLAFDYFSNYDNKALQGKIKSMGFLNIDYYASYENEALVGKLKAVGSSAITYHSSFDDKFIKGKIKSIGSYTYTWYTSLDRIGLGGSLRSGAFRQNIGDVVYIIQ
jgi:hypothetical protein